MNYLVIFIISLVCILLELLLTSVLGLKAWNHVVYTVIPFAILGYGIGANIFLIKEDFFLKFEPRRIWGISLILLSLISIFVFTSFISLPIEVDYLLQAFKDFNAMFMLSKAYTLFTLPFIVMGFTVVYVFRKNPSEANWLYFTDLIGAGLGAAAFFFLIYHFEVFRSVILISVILFFIGSCLLINRIGIALTAGCFFLLGAGFLMPEPLNYMVDPQKGWEWIPGKFPQNYYDLMSSHWQPLGRTDLYRMKGKKIRSAKFFRSTIPFQIDIDPHPEFAYFVTNFLSGTPVFRYEALANKQSPYKIRPFSEIVEMPYLLLKNPRVFIIGAGGGRDIFMARTHGAKDVIGAEVNTEIVRNMSKGGAAYNYSGKIYDQGKIFAVDARHLVKTETSNQFDYLILNGVDTFNGLSSGAYSYAESYLYTKEAIKDYLRILNDRGELCFFRWLFTPPRETLRLQVMAFQALKEMGIERPWKNVLVFDADTWGLTLVRKTPFTAAEIKTLSNYANQHNGRLLFPTKIGEDMAPDDPYRFFDLYGQAYQEGKSKAFIQSYPYDISMVTDDKPFFYKYYKFYWDDLEHPTIDHHTGPVIFWTQFFVLLQSIIFIVLFIFLPLAFLKRTDVLVGSRQGSFITYFACLGLGYMFIEIPLMQKFVLFVGSPIYSISVVLAGLLFWTGIGSYGLPLFNGWGKAKLVRGFVLSVISLMLLYFNMSFFLESIMAWPLWGRIMLIIFLLAPMGCFLGLFFPAGLKLISKKDPALISWAWGINCGFSVLGSMLAIILAQFWGFNFVLLAACLVYILAAISLKNLSTMALKTA